MRLLVAQAPQVVPDRLALAFVPARVAARSSEARDALALTLFVKTTWRYPPTEGRAIDAAGRLGVQLVAADAAPFVAADLDGDAPHAVPGGVVLGPDPASAEEVTWRRDDGATLAAVLPAERPRVLVVAGTRLARDREADTRLHRVVVDEARGAIDLVHRAEAPVARHDAADVDSVVLAFVADAAWDEEAELEARWLPIRAELPRGRFTIAVTRSEVEAGREPPPLDDDELAMARYSTFDCEAPPSPTMTVERFAQIGAQLAEQTEPRTIVLERHGLTEYLWTVEELAFADLVARVPDEGDDEPLAQRYGAAMIREQDRLATAAEARRTVVDYARLVARMEQGDPRRAMSDEGIGLGAFMRLERAMLARAAEDPAFADELARALEAERAARDAAAGDPPELAGADVEGEEEHP